MSESEWNEILKRLDTDTSDENEELLESNDETIHSSNGETSNSSPIKISNEIIDSKPNQFFIQEVYNNPKPVRKESMGNIKKFYVQINSSNNEDEIIKFLKEYTADKKRYYFHFESENMFRVFSNIVNKLFNRNGPEIIYCTERREVIQDEELINQAIKFQHEGKTNHRGVNETIRQLQRKYYFPSMKEYVSNYIAKCEICKKNKIVKKINENTRNPFKIGQTVFERCYKYARNKSGPKFSGPFIITKLLPGNKALIQKVEGNKSKQNIGRTVHLKNLRQPIVTGSSSSQQSAESSS